jgi:acyl-CoA thioesterase
MAVARRYSLIRPLRTFLRSIWAVISASRAAGSPESTAFTTKPALAKETIGRALDSGLRPGQTAGQSRLPSVPVPGKLGAVGSFEEDVVVEPCGGGRYHGQLDHSWDLVAVPQGGIVASLALRAASLEIGDPGQLLRTCTTVFAGQVAAGPLDIHVSVLRRGRSATQVQAAVRNKGAEAGASIVAVFGSSRRGPSFVDAVPPEVPPPLACPSYREPPPPGIQPFEPLPFWTRVEGRAALGHPPWEQHEPTGSDVATWLRFDSPPQLADGAIDPLGVLTLADRMPGCVAERLGHQGPPWFAPSADLTVHLLEPLRTEWLLAHDRARWADDGWASAESVLWDENGTLVAYATQMMLFTYLPDKPEAT